MSDFVVNFDMLSTVTRNLNATVAQLNRAATDLNSQNNRLILQRGFGIPETRLLLNRAVSDTRRLSSEVGQLVRFTATLQDIALRHENMAHRELSGVIGNSKSGNLQSGNALLEFLTGTPMSIAGVLGSFAMGLFKVKGKAGAAWKTFGFAKLGLSILSGKGVPAMLWKAGGLGAQWAGGNIGKAVKAKGGAKPAIKSAAKGAKPALKTGVAAIKAGAKKGALLGPKGIVAGVAIAGAAVAVGAIWRRVRRR